MSASGRWMLGGLAVCLLLAGCPLRGCACGSSQSPGRVASVRGTVFLERGATRTACAPGLLRWGDAIETEADSGATVALANGGSLELRPLSRFAFNQDVGNVVIKLERGVILSRTADASPGAIDIQGLEVTLVTPDGTAHLTAPRSELLAEVSPGQTRLEVHIGRAVLLSQRGEKVSLGANEHATLRAGALVAQAAPTPPPLAEAKEPAPLPVTLPSEPNQTIYHSAAEPVTLSWADRGGPYRVEVSASPTFRVPLMSQLAHRPYVNVTAPAKGSLFWRVFKQGSNKPFSKGSARFRPETATQPVGAVRNELSEGEDTTIYYQDRPPAIACHATPDARATSYRLLVYREGQADPPVFDRTVPTEHASIDAGLLGDGSYVWSLSPLAPGGQPLRGGRMTKVEIVFDNSEPKLVVHSPANGQRFSGGPVRIQGVAPVGARVWLNGGPLALDAQHRFDTQAVPQGNPPVLVFRWQRHGAVSTTVRVLK